MRKFIRTTALMVLALLVLSACQPLVLEEAASTRDENLRRVSGEAYLPAVPEWGGVVISMDVDVAEVDPETHEASGYINWRT